MIGGLIGLLDDIAALAKLFAASLDNVSAAAGRTTAKTAVVVVVGVLYLTPSRKVHSQ